LNAAENSHFIQGFKISVAALSHTGAYIMALAGFFIVCGFLLSVFLLFKFPRFMFTFGIGALILQLLLYSTRAELINDSFIDLPAYFVVLLDINPGFLLGVITSIFPFPLPLIGAYLVGSITVNTQLGLTAFFLFSVIQVVLLGVFTKSETGAGKTMRAVTGFAIPIFTFLVTVVNLFLPGDQQLLDLSSVGNSAVFIGICCCSFVIFAIIAIAFFYLFKKGSK
jgi:hypothetical protein